MKIRLKHIATALAASLQLAICAAVPLAWEVRPGQPAPVMFDRYHGETLAFSAAFRGFGELPFAQDADVRLWYQTNGMGSAWWSAPATIRSNILSAVWSPELDPGAERVSLFFGAPSNAYAAAVLRLRHSPGFAPGAMPDPESFRESDPVFAAWLATYVPPETSLEPATNYTDRVLSSFAATGTVARAATYGTPNRWTDATGCVWEVVIDSQLSVEYKDPEYGQQYGIRIEPSGLGNGMYWVPMAGEAACGVAKGDEDSTILVWEGDAITDFTATRTLVVTTNLVGRVALTNDIPDVSGYATQQQATNAATAVADTKISTNNAAFVSAVLAVPLTGADASDIAELSEYGSYGTVGAAILALIAGLAALKRRITSAETALAQKASFADLPYALVTPGEWEFSGLPSDATSVSVAFNGFDAWTLTYLDSNDVAHTDFVGGSENDIELDFTASGIIATRASLPGHLLDRAVNEIPVSTDAELTLPALVNAGKARDFLVRLAISGSTVPTITFAAPTGETITYETDGDEFPVPDAEGTWLYSFTETAAHTFAVSLKKVSLVTQGGS